MNARDYIVRADDLPEIVYAEPGKPAPVLYRYTIPLAPVSKKNSQQILTNRATGSATWNTGENTLTVTVTDNGKEPTEYTVIVTKS